MGAVSVLFSIKTYDYLATAFVEAGGYERGEVERKTFPDGERYLRVVTPVWGRDIVLLGGTPHDLDCLELYDLGHALVRAGARSLSMVIPYLGYSTMERATRPGEVVTAFTRARLLASIPECEAGSRIFFFDLHTDGIEFYFGDAHVTRHLYGAPVVTAAVRRHMAGRSYVLGATDAGRAKWVQSLASDLGVMPAFIYKKRDVVSGALSLAGIHADVQGQEVVIYDDMIRTGGSLLQAGQAYLEAGATAVHAVASHLVLPPGSLERLRSSGIFTSILGSDSHPNSQQLADEPGALFSVAEHMVRAVERGD
jgi:ribose-phosphate pyrophosphokinase